MYKRHQVSEGRRIERESFVSLILKSRIDLEIKYCAILLGDTFVKSKKQINFIRRNDIFEPNSVRLLSNPCKKQYSVLLFEICKLIAKKLSLIHI